MGLNNQEPCHTTHMEIPPVNKNCGQGAKTNLAFAFSIFGICLNALPHSVTGHQPYELMFGCKAPTVCDAWLGWQNIMTSICKARVHG